MFGKLLEPHVLALAIVVTPLAWLVWNLIRFRNFPSAPGGPLSAWSGVWYYLKVWEGRFEKWEQEAHENHGKVIRVTPRMYVLDDPAAAKQVYAIQSPLRKSKWYQAFGDPRVQDHNVFSTQDPKVHAQMRRKLGNLYSMSSIKSYEPYVNNCIEILMEQFDRIAANDETIDLAHWMQCYAFDVIGEITFGRRLGFMESGGVDIDNIMRCLEEGVSFQTMAGLCFALAPVWLLRYANPTAGISSFVERSIQRHAGKPKGNGEGAQTFFEKSEAIQAKSTDEFEKEQVRGSMNANVGAGSDTTGIALTSAMFNIFKHRNVHFKLLEEIRSAVASGQASEPITFAEASKLPYLQMVVREALRIHPSVGLPLWRVVPAGGMNICDKHFPEGAIVGVNSFAAHFNKSVFGADADVFRPERWDPSETGAEQLSQMEAYWMPFGLGTRTCLGKNISLLEMTKAIPEIVKHFELEPLVPEMTFRNHWFTKQRNVWTKIRRVSKE